MYMDTLMINRVNNYGSVSLLNIIRMKNKETLFFLYHTWQYTLYRKSMENLKHDPSINLHKMYTVFSCCKPHAEKAISTKGSKLCLIDCLSGWLLVSLL